MLTSLVRSPLSNVDTVGGRGGEGKEGEGRGRNAGPSSGGHERGRVEAALSLLCCLVLIEGSPVCLQT